MRPFLEDTIRDALMQPAPLSLRAAHTDAAARADAATRQIPDDGGFHAYRFFVAIMIFASLRNRSTSAARMSAVGEPVT